MKNKISLIKKITIFLMFKFFLMSSSYSDNIKEFKISGNDRISDETIIMFSNLEIGESINNILLNNSLKDLYDTNYFSDLKLSYENGIVSINVVENPIIQSISINGIDKNNILDQIKKVTNKIEKYPFVESNINEQVILLKNILKSYGYYFVKVETYINKNLNNSVDLTYNFELGEIAKISKISFIGDKYFRDGTLRNVIVSEESKFWKFLTKNKFLNTERIKLDEARLNTFYENRGFLKANIKSTTTIINENNQFELVFNINSGNKYYFDNFKIKSNPNFEIKDIEIFQTKLNKLKGKKYSKKIINKNIEEINNFALRNDFIFINANYEEIVKDKYKVDILISFDDLEKSYVERINIYGNYITEEKVFRNSFIIDEGDPFNEILFKKSIQNLKAKNIFSDVSYEINEKESQNKTINIIVKEKATGEIFAGAGTGTDGSTISAGIKENNYLGLGIKLDTNATITDDTIKGKFSITNPNYADTDKLVSASIESSANDFMSASGYKTSRTGFSLGTEFEQKENLFVNLELSNFYEDLETSPSATSILKKQEGNYIENLLSYTLTYNSLDQNFQPTDGYLNKFSQTLPLYSDDMSLENTFISSLYHSLNNDFIFSGSFYLKTINSLEDNVRISKRIFIPGRRLRGFESGKIGPKDGSQYIGGNYAAALNFSTTLPNILFENENIDLNLFLDMANLWEVDFNETLDSSKIRSSTGFAINWFSPIGPLTLSYAVPLSEASTDITQKLRFQIGTSF